MFNAVMFHHFHGKNHPKTIGSVNKNELSKIIQYLKKNYNLLNAEQFLNKTKNNGLDPKDVCLTFDDSLKCQYDIAYPILQREYYCLFLSIQVFLIKGKFNGNLSRF